LIIWFIEKFFFKGLAGKITMGDGKVLQDTDIMRRLASASCTMDGNTASLLRASQKQMAVTSSDSKSSAGDQSPSNRLVFLTWLWLLTSCNEAVLNQQFTCFCAMSV
jgi:hypothetical protein